MLVIVIVKIIKTNYFTILSRVKPSLDLENAMIECIIQFKKRYQQILWDGPRVIVILGPTPYSKGSVPYSGAELPHSFQVLYMEFV